MCDDKRPGVSAIQEQEGYSDTTNCSTLCDHGKYL